MPKTKISEYSATANSNTDVASINIDEGCAPSGINNAIRAIMGHLKDFQSGTSNDPFTVGSSGSLTLSYGTANGVAYLNGSKVLTTGSALVFDGTNLGVGITPTTKLHVSSASNTFATVESTNGAAYWQMIGNNATNASYNTLISKYGATTDWSISGGNGTSGTMVFSANGSERMRLDSSGNLLVGASITSSINGTFCPIQGQNNTANQVAYFRNTNANPYGIIVNYSAASPNNTGNEFIYCSDSTAQRFSARSNGGLANYSANNVNLASDLRLKRDIEPVQSYWNVFKSIEWKTWLYNDQTDEIKNIGVIAQELQALAPELVCESNALPTPEGESPYLGLWENDFKMAGMSVITELVKRCEEQQAIIQSLTARITALEGA